MLYVCDIIKKFLTKTVENNVENFLKDEENLVNKR